MLEPAGLPLHVDNLSQLEYEAMVKVVFAAGEVLRNGGDGDLDYFARDDLRDALAQLESINVEIADSENQPKKNFSELGTDASLRSESESAT